MRHNPLCFLLFYFYNFLTRCFSLNDGNIVGLHTKIFCKNFYQCSICLSLYRRLGNGNFKMSRIKLLQDLMRRVWRYLDKNSHREKSTVFCVKVDDVETQTKCLFVLPRGALRAFPAGQEIERINEARLKQGKIKFIEQRYVSRIRTI